ncbi:hypothetical protein MTO96_045048 [Rhipicephalus appendiculatus]
MNEQALTELLADCIATIPVAQPNEVINPRVSKPPTLSGQPASQIRAVWEEPILAHELNSAVARAKRRSTLGADGCWRHSTRCGGTTPYLEAWLTSVAVPVRKTGKPGGAITSCRPRSPLPPAGLRPLHWLA